MRLFAADQPDSISRYAFGVFLVFNVGADTPYTILKLADQIAAAFKVERKVQYLPARNEVVHAFSDHSRVRSVFNPPAPIDLRTGIQRMAEWVKARGPACPVSFAGIELTKSLPASWRG